MDQVWIGGFVVEFSVRLMEVGVRADIETVRPCNFNSLEAIGWWE